jgi:hypothetical protein
MRPESKDSGTGPINAFDPGLALPIVGAAIAGPLIKTALTGIFKSRPARGPARSAGTSYFPTIAARDDAPDYDAGSVNSERIGCAVK